MTATGPVTARRGEGVTTSDADLETKVVAVYAQNRFGVNDRLAITPGVRYENIHQEQFNTITRRSGTANTDVVSPNLGTTYQIGGNSMLFANIGRAFRAPTFVDAFDATTSAERDLDPSFAWTYEAGARTSPWSWLTADIAAFLFDFEDQVVISGGVAQNFDTKSVGAEGSLDVGLVRLLTGAGRDEKPDHEFSLGGSFSLLDTEFKNGAFSGKELPYAPNQQFGWYGRYEWGNRATAQLQGRWVAEQFADNANTVAENAAATLGEIPSYSVWDLNLLGAITDTISLSAGVRNLFDKKYIVQRDSFFRGIVPGADRTYYVGTKIAFGPRG
jgi:Fe(3+) dicitrate transport protein